jgi:shikimate 5-dehydrogenase
MDSGSGLGSHSRIGFDQRPDCEIGDASMSLPLVRADVPTIHFIGVSTSQSSIMKAFPRWAAELGLPGVAIRGVDLPLNALTESYREVVRFIRHDEGSRGALVTTHKIDVFRAAHDQFDEFDWFAQAMHEVSSISKRNGRLIGQAKDPISAGRTLDSMIEEGFWETGRGLVYCMGSGGAGVAITWFLLKGEHKFGRPVRAIVSDISENRLDNLKQLVDSPGLETRLVKSADDNDALMRTLPPGSLVVNATGLGKDRPGSPITDAASFPKDSIIWELNYRGELGFLEQARRQSASRNLRIHDGWDYFIHGWTSVIGDVFAIEIPDDLPTFRRLSDIAKRASGRL